VLTLIRGWLLFAGIIAVQEGLDVGMAVPDQAWADIGATEPLFFVPLDRAQGSSQPFTEVLASVVGRRFVVHARDKRYKIVSRKEK